ncbi:autotransporter assembly complex family protein [soil metagenome]
MLIPVRLLTLAAMALFAATAQAATVARVDVVGLDEDMTENVRVALSVIDAIGDDLPARRIAYLLRVAEEETREALEPFGYYSPTITVTRTRDGVTRTVGDAHDWADDEDARAAADHADTVGDRRGNIAITVTVDPGEPVRVRNADIAILGDGGRDRYLQRDLGRFTPAVGDILDHPTYEASKLRITRRLAERGYFDADFSSRRVEVTRADLAADIDLVWSSGERYAMGPISFEQTPEAVVYERLLQKLVYWNQGEYYHQGRLDRLRKSLVALDYFSQIDIQPLPGQAVDRQVPIEVTLVPAPRSIYTAGVSYGTESGAGVRLGVERRYVNQRGHKALAQLDYAQNLKALTLQYRIPAFAWLDGWYTASLRTVEERSEYIDSRRAELVGSRSGQYNENLNLIASGHVLRERWLFAPEDNDPEAPRPYRYASYAFPQLRAEYIDVDDRLFPTRGIGGSLRFGGGVEGAGSDRSFAQLHARATWFRGIGERNRLILRGELGRTFVEDVVELPPSLRFYAGGERSIRGYEFREVGPRLPATGSRKAYSLGAENLVTASIEFERYFTRTLGAAVFVDSGDAFNGSTPDWRTGVGIGVRYRTPVGPLKFDLARGLDRPASAFTIGLSIGADF